MIKEIDFKNIEQYNCFIKNLLKKKYKIYIKGSNITILFIKNNNETNYIFVFLVK